MRSQPSFLKGGGGEGGGLMYTGLSITVHTYCPCRAAISNTFTVHHAH